MTSEGEKKCPENLYELEKNSSQMDDNDKPKPDLGKLEDGVSSSDPKSAAEENQAVTSGSEGNLPKAVSADEGDQLKAESGDSVGHQSEALSEASETHLGQTTPTGTNTEATSSQKNREESTSAENELKLPREHESLWGLLSQIPKKAQRGLLMQCDLVLTCMDADSEYVVLGTNIGLVFLYDRKKQAMERLRSESSSDVVTCVQLHQGVHCQVAVGMASGSIYIFQLPSLQIGLKKQLQKFMVKNMHRSYLKCVEWSTNGMKLFSGDKSGTVVTTEVDFYEGQCKSAVLLVENHAEIIQLHYNHKALLVSTKQRTIVCRLDDRDRLVHIGQQDRKVQGGFGACFLPGMCKTSDAQVYAVRPGCRIWKSDIEGHVQNTYIFKDLFSVSNPEIQLIKPEKPFPVTNDPQFGKLLIYREKQLVTWTSTCFYILYPESNVVIARQCNMGYISDVCVFNDEVFILRRNAETSLIRIAENPEPLVSGAYVFSHGTASEHNTHLPSSLMTSSFIEETRKKEKHHMSPKTFFKKNVLGKFKFLDLVSHSDECKDLKSEVSVRQLIDDGDSGCIDVQPVESDAATAVRSPDLPPVVKLNSPELTSLQVYAGVAGSPLSPDSDSSKLVTQSAATDTVVYPEVPTGHSDVHLSIDGKTNSDVVIQHTSLDDKHNASLPADHVSVISERVHIHNKGQKDAGDIVFSQKGKKNKKKKHKHGKYKGKDDDEISQHSDTSQTYPDDFKESKEATDETPLKDQESLETTDTLRIADEILKRTREIIQGESSSAVQRQSSGVSRTDSVGSSMSDHAHSSLGSSTAGADVNPSSISYWYKVDENSLPGVDCSDRTIRKLDKVARSISAIYDVPPVNKKSDTADSNMPSETSHTRAEAQQPSSLPHPDTAGSKSGLYMVSDTSADDFYSKYSSHQSQSSAESSVASPQEHQPVSSPESEAEQGGRMPAEPCCPPGNKSVSTGDEDTDFKGGTLRRLANIWSEISAPANIYSLVLTESHVWFTDKSEHIYFSSVTGPRGVVWRKASGSASQISVSKSGSIVWRLHRNVVYAGTKITAKHPEGLKWVEAVQNHVAYITVDDSCGWYIKTDGDIMIQKGLSVDRPCFRSQKVPCSLRMKQLVCKEGVVWGITEDYKLVYRTGVTASCQEGTEWVGISSGSENLLFASVTLGNDKTGWVLDVVGRIWFCCGVTMETPFGNGYLWQVPISEYFVQDATTLDTLRSLASKFDPQKLSLLLSSNRGGLIAAGGPGVWVCLEYKNILQVCRGSIEGYRWEEAQPVGMAPSIAWKIVSAGISHLDWGLVWAQQPNGEMYAFEPSSRKGTVIPSSPMFVCLHAGPTAVWGLDMDGRTWVRAGMGPYCPQGASWSELDLTQLGDSQLVHVSCNATYVWAVDCDGNVYQRIGAKAPQDQQLSPAWLPIDSFSGIVFTQIVVGPLDWMVWAVDNKRLAYVRLGITENMPIGKEWVHVPGTQIVQMTLSKTGVWALNSQGEVLFRYGITQDNVCGDYWKKVPGVCTHLTASASDDLWAVDRQGHLLQCHTHYFLRRQDSQDPLLQRTVSTGSEEGEWELV